MTLTYASLASGTGGLDLAVEAVLDAELIWHAEFATSAAIIHERYWPNINNLHDVTTADWSGLERPDILCGGYPCQPFSSAGERKGFNDPRNLWPYFQNAIRILRPQLVILENVAAHLSLGFGRVLGDLADLWYDAEWGVFRASEVGAPHPRARVFIVAYTPGTRCEGRLQRAETPRRNIAPNGDSFPWRKFEPAIRRWESIRGEHAPTPLDSRGLDPTFVEWLMGFPIGWTEGIARTARLKGLGNAVLPPQGESAIRVLLDRITRHSSVELVELRKELRGS